MASDRLREKNDLFVKLGALFGPLLDVASHPDSYDEQEKAEAVARYCCSMSRIAQEFSHFSMGQPEHLYAVENQRFSNAIHGVQSQLAGNPDLFIQIVRRQFTLARDALDAVPIPRTSEILEAGTPFATYVRLRELTETDATKSLIWIDPHVDHTIFHRYLSGVRPEVATTIVTEEPGPRSGPKDRLRWNGFLDVSRLFAQERGPDRYRLLLASSQHDRWVVFDEKRIYSLGGSVKDAGSRDHFTLTTIEASQPNRDRIAAIVSDAKELFGPNTVAHA